jgi:hypothetical protein
MTFVPSGDMASTRPSPSWATPPATVVAGAVDGDVDGAAVVVVAAVVAGAVVSAVVVDSATVVVGALVDSAVVDGAVATSPSPSQPTSRRAAIPANIRNRILSGHG